MVLISYSGREINAKLVYYGPGLSGKTTNLEYIYGAIPQSHRGKMVSMKTKTERTLFFDFLPIDLGELAGFKTRFLLYTVPGQVYYNATRKLVLKGVDAIVFVADSKRGKMDENVESLQNLRDNLREQGIDLDRIPWVIQYNKRDLSDIYSIDELQRSLNPNRTVPSFEAIGTTGLGVFETFKAVSRLLLKHLSQEIGVRVIGPQRGEAESQSTAAPPGRQAAVRPATEPMSSWKHAAAPPAETPTPGRALTGQRTEVAPNPPSMALPPRVEGSTPPPFPAPGAMAPVTLSASSEKWEEVPPKGAPPVPTASDVDFEHDRPSPPPPQSSEPARMPGMGDRLRRWLSRSREPEAPAAADRAGEPVAPVSPAPDTPAASQGPPPVEVGRSISMESDEEPGTEIPPEPFVEPQDDELVPVNMRAASQQPVRVMPAIPAAARRGDDRRARREAPTLPDEKPVVREVPVTIEIDPDDLERGVILRLVIRARREVSRETGTGQDRAA